MKQPEFWHNDPNAPGIVSTVLLPLARVATWATAKRVARVPDYTAKIPVICVGNLNVGGTGKTPATIWLIDKLKTAGFSPHVVTRGYHGKLQGPVLVDESKHVASDVGDEPLLLTAFAPTWVAKDRASGVRAAEKAGASVILLDDGLQNPTVTKDFSIVVVDALRGFGNGRVMPAGPLREPVAAGIKRADAVLVIGPDRSIDEFLGKWQDQLSCDVLHGQLRPLQTGMDWQGLRVMAFAGIGHPEKFFRTLQDLGVEIIRTVPLDDHQALPSALLKRLEAEAKSQNAQLVTTEKDAVRLPSEFRQKVLTVPVRLHVEQANWLDQRLREWASALKASS